MNEHTYIGDQSGAAPVEQPAPAGPHNLEAEQALLGALLVNNEVHNLVGDFLAPEHFFEHLHGRIYETCRSLIEAGHRVNPITIHHHFAGDEALMQLGGMAYFAHLAAACPAIVTAPD
jgi:replicative DNA helicase